LGSQHPSLSYVQNDKYVIPEAFLYIKYKLSDKISVAAARRSSVKTDGVPKFGSFQGNVNAQLNDRNRIQLAGGIYRRFQLQNAGVDLAQVVSSKQVSLDYLHERKKFKIQSALYAKETSYKSYINPIIGAELFFEYDYGPLKTSISLAHIQSEIETDEFRYPTPNNFDIFLRWIGKYEWVGVCAISAIYIHRNGIYYQPVINSTYHEQTDTYIPSYIGLEEGRMLADYQVLDLNLSKTFIVGEGSLISFVSASNTFNRKNQKSASYSSDYVQNGFNYFNQRVIFAGMVYNW